MLVEQAMTVENAGTVGSTPASISTSRAMLLQLRLGTTLPQTAKSGLAPFSRPTIWRIHRDRERDGVEAAQSAIDFGEGRADTGGEPNFGH